MNPLGLWWWMYICGISLNFTHVWRDKSPNFPWIGGIKRISQTLLIGIWLFLLNWLPLSIVPLAHLLLPEQSLIHYCGLLCLTQHGLRRTVLCSTDFLVFPTLLIIALWLLRVLPGPRVQDPGRDCPGPLCSHLWTADWPEPKTTRAQGQRFHLRVQWRCLVL